MKKLFKVTLVILITLIMVFSIFACSKSKTASKNFTPKPEYKLSVVVGPTFGWGIAAQRFADEVKEKTNGKINIKVYYGGQLFAGKQTNEFQILATGAADFAFGSTINWSPVVPELNIFSLPFFINNYTNLDKIENGKTGKMLFERLSKKGVIGLAWAENGFREITNSKRPIKEPSDLKGLKIRVVGSPIFLDIYKQLGADPINMNWGDAVTAFQQGAVDGQENPADILKVVKIWQYHKYATFWNYLVDPVIVGVNKKLFESFPKDIQKIIKDAAANAAEFEKAYVRVGLDDGSSLKLLQTKFNYTPDVSNFDKFFKENGLEVTYLTSDQLAMFKEATASIYDKWIEKIGKDIYESAKADMNK